MSLNTADLKVRRVTAIEDDRGLLSVFQPGTDIQIDIARVFVVNAKVGTVRGGHAHRKCTQVMVCVHGQCEIVCDDGTSTTRFLLETPDSALLVPPGIWAEQRYLSTDTVLMVLCDRPYEADDYLRNYEAFVAAYAGGEK